MTGEPEYRPLNEEERRICEKQLARLSEEAQHTNFYVQYETLMVNQGLRVNFEKAMKEHTAKLKDACEQQATTQTSITILTEQLNRGVLKKPAQDETPVEAEPKEE